MELGALFKDTPFDYKRIPIGFLSAVISRVRVKKITSRSAKRILTMCFEGDTRTAQTIIAVEGLEMKTMSRTEYVALARQLLDEKPEMVRDIMEKGQQKKVMWFVGQMIGRSREGSVDPKVAEEVVMELLGLSEPQW